MTGMECYTLFAPIIFQNFFEFLLRLWKKPFEHCCFFLTDAENKSSNSKVCLYEIKNGHNCHNNNNDQINVITYDFRVTDVCNFTVKSKILFWGHLHLVKKWYLSVIYFLFFMVIMCIVLVIMCIVRPKLHFGHTN